MGDFFDSIRKDLDALDTEHSGPEPTFGVEAIHHVPAHGTLPHDAPAHDSFGADYNSNSSVIKQVQAAINALGYAPPLTVDGAIGPKTIAGVKWVQDKQGVAQDGIVGDQTLGALGITPPGGTSVQSAVGAVKGAASTALAALQQEFAPLLTWAAHNPQPIVQGKGIAPGFQATRASVVNSFKGWTKALEGWTTWMYIDALGYVTTGMGNKIDPISQALALSWQRPDGSAASQGDIQAAWNAVDALRVAPKGEKQTSGPGAQGGGTQGGVTSIRLTTAGIQKLIDGMLKSNESYLLKGLPNFAKAPADAQLGSHSMAWAEGPMFAQTWPAFRNAFNTGDYATAADQSHMQGVGIDMRNAANKLLFKNAAQVVATKKDPDVLYYIDGLTQLFSPTGILANAMQHPVRTAGVVLGVAAVTWAAIRAALKGTP